MDRRLAHRDHPIADVEGIDAKVRPSVAQPRTCNQLAEGCDSPLERIARQSRHRLPKRGSNHIGHRLHRSCDIGIGLKVLIDHSMSPAVGEDQWLIEWPGQTSLPLHDSLGNPAGMARQMHNPCREGAYR